MKILWLYSTSEEWDFNHWFHVDFVRNLNLQKEVEVLIYGPGMHEYCSDLAYIPYDSKMQMKDILKEFEFNDIIVDGKGRMFSAYLPPKGYDPSFVGECWIPSDFKSLDIPKLSIEDHSHYELDDNWHHEQQIDIILQRHYFDLPRDNKIRSIWFPFSVDINIFKPGHIERQNKITIIGTLSPIVYPFRTQAGRMLIKKPYFKNLGRLYLNDDYILQLQIYAIFLSGSSRHFITPAKMFEIIASGAILLTNNPVKKYGLDKLFSENCYLTYNPDFSDIIEKTEWILGDADAQKKIVSNGLKEVREKHSDQKRSQDLINILNEEF